MISKVCGLNVVTEVSIRNRASLSAQFRGLYVNGL